MPSHLPPYGKIQVYIACPYTKGDVGTNVHRANREWDLLFDMGLIPVNPLWTHFQHMHQPRLYSDWMAYHEESVRRCDALLRLCGDSRGADNEVALAQHLCKPVFYSREALAAWAFQKPFWTRPVLRGYSPSTLAVCGFGGHGKGTAAQMLSKMFGYRYLKSTSQAAAEVVFDVLKDRYHYADVSACWEDRQQHRAEWEQIIADYNADDKARLCVAMVDSGNDILEGVRRKDEFQACRREGLFECAIWIDAGLRVACREQSCEVEPSDCDVTIDNNGGLADLESQLGRWCRDMGLGTDG
jgi:hypothetical protein